MQVNSLSPLGYALGTFARRSRYWYLNRSSIPALLHPSSGQGLFSLWIPGRARNICMNLDPVHGTITHINNDHAQESKTQGYLHTSLSLVKSAKQDPYGCSR